MHLRMALLAAAAVVAAGLMGITPAANAGVELINYVHVNGNTSGVHAISGTYSGGAASFGGGTYTCFDGGFTGDATAGAVPPGGHIDFTSLDIVCATPLGINQTITIDSGCADFDPIASATVTDGKSDTAVPGIVTLGTDCGTLNYASCTAHVDGQVGATYNEDSQQQILNGSGFALSDQSIGCLGLISGSVGLNGITFDVDDSAGGIDFRTTP